MSHIKMWKNPQFINSMVRLDQPVQMYHKNTNLWSYLNIIMQKVPSENNVNQTNLSRCDYFILTLTV